MKLANEELDAETKQKMQDAFDLLLNNDCLRICKILSRLKWRNGLGKTKTIAITRGRRLCANPFFIETQTRPEVAFHMAHETGHLIQMAFSEEYRTDEWRAQPVRANRALDLEINGRLKRDPVIGRFVTARLEDGFCFPEKMGFSWLLSAKTYFDLLGPQTDEDPNLPIDIDEAAQADETEGTQSDDSVKEDIEDALNGEGAGEGKDSLLIEDIIKNYREGKRQHQANWVAILSDYLRSRGSTQRATKRPSRRWDGKGVMLMKGGTRSYPKMALVLDYSGSMATFVAKAARETTRAIAEIGKSGCVVIACNTRIIREWKIERNGKIPPTEEFLSHFHGGGTHMGPAFDRAREVGAKVILCVSDMETCRSDLEQKDVVWITNIGNERKSAGRVLPILNV